MFIYHFLELLLISNKNKNFIQFNQQFEKKWQVLDLLGDSLYARGSFQIFDDSNYVFFF